MKFGLRRICFSLSLWSVVLCILQFGAFGQHNVVDKTKDEPVKTANFKFVGDNKETPTYYTKHERSISNIGVSMRGIPVKYDWSFLRKYEFRRYNMADFTINNALIDMPFHEWPGSEIPFTIKQQTFDIVKPRKPKRNNR